MQIRHERSRSPEDMFVAGLLQRGARGLDLRPQPDLEEDIGNMHQYGVDWAVHRDTRLMQHLRDHNATDEDGAVEPFRLPDHMARVECEPPNCPFDSEQMVVFRAELAGRIAHQIHRRDMPSRRIIWCHAFAIASDIRTRRL
jgi:hypothetical protein